MENWEEIKAVWNKVILNRKAFGYETELFIYILEIKRFIFKWR